MRIFIDAHTLGRRQTGNEVYTRNLINELEKYRPKLVCDLACSFPASSSDRRADFRRIRVSGNPFLRLGWDLPRQLRYIRPDVLHVQYTAPLGVAVPVVVTVHDVSFLERAEFFHPLRDIQLRRTVAHTVLNAERVITPSEFSRQAVLRQYRVDPNKVLTIANGVSETFHPMDREISRRWIARKYGICAPFILAVGNIEARKNPMGLLRAFEFFLREWPQLPHHLVFAGKDGWQGGEVRRAAARSPVQDRIHFAGYIPDGDLVELYAASEVFVFPSFYEGFGLPVMEAMACGRAVACSNRAAMPEVAGDAALYFDPSSTSGMASVIARMLTDDALRARFERAGVERARGFSWARSARMTLDVYRAVAAEQGPQHSPGRQLEDRPLLPAAPR